MLIKFSNVMTYRVSKATMNDDEEVKRPDYLVDTMVSNKQLAENERVLNEHYAALMLRPVSFKDKFPSLEKKDVMKMHATNNKKRYTLGRQETCDFHFKDAGISRHHSSFEYSDDNGWVIDERGKDRLSLGTFIPLKTIEQEKTRSMSFGVEVKNNMRMCFLNFDVVFNLAPPHNCQQEPLVAKQQAYKNLLERKYADAQDRGVNLELAE